MAVRSEGFKIPCWIVTNKYYRKRLPEGDFITVMDKKYQFFISSTYEDFKVSTRKHSNMSA